MSATVARRRAISAFLDRPLLARSVILLALVAGAASALAVGLQAAPALDLELMHLLRAMAILKLAFVAACLWCDPVALAGADSPRLVGELRGGFGIDGRRPRTDLVLEPHHPSVDPAACWRGGIPPFAVAGGCQRGPPARHRDPSAFLITVKTIAAPRRAG